MDTTQYIALSHQAALRRNLDLIANNIANANTTAYRREQVIFQQYIVEMDQGPDREARKVSFVADYGISRDNTQGSFVPTGNPLDLALNGSGYFQVQDTDTGDQFYTRNGRLRISEDGFLTLSTGQQILDTNSDPIAISPEDTDLKINRDGTVTSRLGILTQLNLVQFENEAYLKKVRDSLYETEQDPEPAQNTEVLDGTLENSNINTIKEMTDMISVLRSYQGTNSMLEKYQDLRRTGIERLGRVQ